MTKQRKQARMTLTDEALAWLENVKRNIGGVGDMEALLYALKMAYQMTEMGRVGGKVFVLPPEKSHVPPSMYTFMPTDLNFYDNDKEIEAFCNRCGFVRRESDIVLASEKHKKEESE